MSQNCVRSRSSKLAAISRVCVTVRVGSRSSRDRVTYFMERAEIKRESGVRCVGGRSNLQTDVAKRGGLEILDTSDATEEYPRSPS